MQNVQYSILIHSAANIRTCGVIKVCARELNVMKRLKEWKMMILRAFPVCLVNVSVLLLIFYILNVFSKINCFCFQKHYTTVSFVYDIYISVTVFLFG